MKAGRGWKRAVLEVETPAWDPFIHIVFCLEGGGRAYLDDFRPAEVAGAP